MNQPEYQVGYGHDVYGVPIWIGFKPSGDGRPDGATILVQVNVGRQVEGKVLPPGPMLDFRPHSLRTEAQDGTVKAVKLEREPPGWFERKCSEANCGWFIPIVKRMAAGEQVPLEEIEVAYVAHNGKTMPRGEWHVLFRGPKIARNE